METGISKV